MTKQQDRRRLSRRVFMRGLAQSAAVAGVTIAGSRALAQDAALQALIDQNLNGDFGQGFDAASRTISAISAKFSFRGKTAHGAVNPWDGKDAVDAVVLMDTGYNALREHMRPTQRAHRTITAGGVQPNIIPDFGQAWWFVRDANAPWAKENFDKLVNVARGAALHHALAEGGKLATTILWPYADKLAIFGGWAMQPAVLVEELRLGSASGWMIVLTLRYVAPIGIAAASIASLVR